MEHKIATVEIYMDTETQNSSVTRKTGPHTYRVQINPNQSPGDGSDKFSLKTVKDFQTTLAHELGHFISILTKDETHAPANNLLFQLTGDTSTVIPAEKKAWSLAHIMVPDLNTENEAHAMASYKALDKSRSWREYASPKEIDAIEQTFADGHYQGWSDKTIHIIESLILGTLILGFTVAEFVTSGRIALDVLK